MPTSQEISTSSKHSSKPTSPPPPPQFWYCCSCRYGPMTIILTPACVHCNDHYRCGNCKLE
ncbi:uncharacterized protein F4822DRAFT_389436 [Hypoxylon trugodes]|uniref:uncharacterized protein n=1 Tax=Hypoxylon trugodes TaxID=326681 RepID=UPI0021983461|nr:uncharacterized protein F4822DRAFT_389436 [Hypoxylon trugodes]KAI1392027.1 hypothetical protein F4822DRAFT_389436 [Hypoxylon trugodes]